MIDYEQFLNELSSILWEIDPHYAKLKSRGKSFPRIVKTKFLNFNQPEKHKHKAKPLSSQTMKLRVETFQKYLERKYMMPGHMKGLHDLVSAIFKSLYECTKSLDAQNNRTKYNHENETLPQLLDYFVHEIIVTSGDRRDF